MSVSQSHFRSAMLDPACPVPSGLVGPDGQQTTKRFNVYRNNVAVSLSDALETGFPVVRKLVGDKFFRAMAGVYLRQHPPKSPLMMHYGAEMPDFLAGFEPAQSVPYLPDIARLELGLRRAYHAADATAIDAAALGAVPPDDLMTTRLRLAPATQVITSAYPIEAIYRFNTQENAPKPAMRAEAVLITRAAFDPEIHLISDAAAQSITELLAGQTLGDVINTADETLNIGDVLGLLLGQNAITELL